jgi:ubiquitin-like 1-activating enzyme E1 B
MVQGVTECYECMPKEPPKQFPVCTIRNTPSAPIHCIVWAKFLFKYSMHYCCGPFIYYYCIFSQLFGVADDENDVSPNQNDPAAHTGIHSSMFNTTGLILQIDDQATSAPAQRQTTRMWAAENNYEPRLLFDKVCMLFSSDICDSSVIKHANMDSLS